MYSAIAVIVGAACSSLAGFIGMYAATKQMLEQPQLPKRRSSCCIISIFLWGLSDGLMCSIIMLDWSR